MLFRLNTLPEKTWMVGNSLKVDIQGAVKNGMKTAWLNRNGKPGDVSIIPDIESPDLQRLTETLKTFAIKD
jgi:FMN phosphatase YigB (HAD superfamily)